MEDHDHLKFGKFQAAVEPVPPYEVLERELNQVRIMHFFDYPLTIVKRY